MIPPQSLHPDLVRAHGRALRTRLADRRLEGSGRIEEVTGGVIAARVPRAVIGHLCALRDPGLGVVGQAEIIAIEGDSAFLAPFGLTGGLSRRIEVVPTRRFAWTRLRSESLGCVVDWRGETMSRFASTSPEHFDALRPIRSAPPRIEDRRPVRRKFDTGVRAINALCTLGEGQRIGVFGGAGAGKSTVVDMVVNGAQPDVLVMALIGERGREVVELEERLGSSGNAERTIVYAATSDRPAVERVNAVHAATACAEYWRDRGKSVLLVVDSITRIARALREIGLARGETPTRRGYPVSVFEQLPLLFERAGGAARGSITAVYTVLVEGELAEDPIAEETMSLLDGHIILSRSIAARGIYPAIDVARSLSRSMPSIVDPDHLAAALEYRELLAAYEEIELMVRMGEYREGHDARADRALRLHGAMADLIRQVPHEAVSLDDSIMALQGICQ